MENEKLQLSRKMLLCWHNTTSTTTSSLYTPSTIYVSTMISFKSILSLLMMLVFVTSAVAKKEEEDQALRDLQIGMAGLKEASNNPALLAQLMRDMQVRVVMGKRME